MKTLVTGGTGFIGSHLVKKLVEVGREVVVASDFSRLDIRNLSSLGIGLADIELRRVDLRDYIQALKAVEQAETVFHLAARVGSVEYLHGTEVSELSALQTNLLIDINTFRACLQKDVRKLIYPSSIAVYPMARQNSFDAVFSEEELDVQNVTQSHIDPDGGYGWAKLMGEIQLRWMSQFNIGVARIFNVYGENEPTREKSHVIADLIRKAVLYPQEDFIVWGDGRQSRDFLYVSDCVDALLRLEQVASNPPVAVNIGSGEAISVGAIADKVIEISGKRIEIKYDHSKTIGPLSRTADIRRAKALLGWQPRVDLNEGLRRTYIWEEKRHIS